MLTSARFLAGEGTAAERALFSHVTGCTLCSQVLLRPAPGCVEGRRLEREAEAEAGAGGRRRDRGRGARGRA